MASIRKIATRIILVTAMLLMCVPLQPVDSASQTKALKLFFILLEGNGKFGKKIGCGDSVVPVVIAVEPTATPLRSAFEHLLAVKDDTYCQTGLRNALYQTSLTVQSATISGQTAVIKLVGDYTDGGHCDTPRAKAQFEETALQFPNIKKVRIYVNGKLLTFDPT